MKKLLILLFILSGIAARASEATILLGPVPETGSNDIILVLTATFTKPSEFKKLAIKENDRFQAVETSGNWKWNGNQGHVVVAYIVRPKIKGAKISQADFTGLPGDVIFSRELVSEKYRH